MADTTVCVPCMGSGEAMIPGIEFGTYEIQECRHCGGIGLTRGGRPIPSKFKKFPKGKDPAIAAAVSEIKNRMELNK